ncbi:hypothetical protein Patl1_21665 [Pistacia atlantica]|uniref:Uncharacterized protein n=1 Tax=Pistacia atlantica TaxID=434234 RepID=A0ACC1BJK3_9ROSI|nr:hypothetical protein Patl1_21665 [Pistacia atlantica]
MASWMPSHNIMSSSPHKPLHNYILKFWSLSSSKQLGVLLEQLHTDSSESKAVEKFSDQVLHIAVSLDRLADSLSGLRHSNPPAGSIEISYVDEDLSETEETDLDEGTMSRKAFNAGEIYNYTSPKPHRLVGKKNFLDVDAVSPSVGQVCAKMASIVDRFMTYKVYGACPDDWDIA